MSDTTSPSASGPKKPYDRVQPSADGDPIPPDENADLPEVDEDTAGTLPDRVTPDEFDEMDPEEMAERNRDVSGTDTLLPENTPRIDPSRIREDLR